jgi:DNA-binding transcriptional ArsR family regulator
MVGRDGPLTATELAEHFPVTRQAVAKHLDTLAEAGLVMSARDGRAVRYQLHEGALDTATQWMASVGDAWDRRLHALERRAHELT